MRYLVCSLALLLCLAVLRHAMLYGFEAFGLTGGLIICGLVGGGSIAIGFAIDARDRRRSQEVLPPAPRDHQ
jgi:hypothetical protein